MCTRAEARQVGEMVKQLESDLTDWRDRTVKMETQIDGLKEQLSEARQDRDSWKEAYFAAVR